MQIEFHAVPDRERGGHHLSEAVHRPLDQRQPQRHDHQLQRDRGAHLQRLSDRRAPPYQLAQFEAEDRIFARHVDPRRDHRPRLRDVRGDGGSGAPPAEHPDEEQIEQDVQHRGREQKVQRRRAVAHRPQDRGEDVVAELEDQPGAVDTEVQQRGCEDVFRHRHHFDVGEARKGDPDRRGECAQHEQQHDPRSGGLAHFPVPAGAEVLGDQHAVARGKSDRDREEQEHQRSRGADRRQFVLPRKVGDHEHVDRVVELLEQ